MIVKRLLDSGICFAIVQSYSFLTRGKLTTNQQIEIIASSNDWGKLGKLGFQRNNDPNLPIVHKNPKGIVSRELDLVEASEFRNFLNEVQSPFIKVIESEDGRVYEIYGNSFRAKFMQQNMNQPAHEH